MQSTPTSKKKLFKIYEIEIEINGFNSETGEPYYLETTNVGTGLTLQAAIDDLYGQTKQQNYEKKFIPYNKKYVTDLYTPPRKQLNGSTRH